MGKRQGEKESSDSSSEENENESEKEENDNSSENNNEMEGEDENEESHPLDQMMERIETMKEWEIPGFTSSNDSLMDIITETNRIRDKVLIDDYDRLAAEMKAFTENKKMIKAFTNFREICQFIMHIHIQYAVPLVPISKKTKHFDAVSDTINNVLGK